MESGGYVAPRLLWRLGINSYYALRRDGKRKDCPRNQAKYIDTYRPPHDNASIQAFTFIGAGGSMETGGKRRACCNVRISTHIITCDSKTIRHFTKMGVAGRSFGRALVAGKKNGDTSSALFLLIREFTTKTSNAERSYGRALARTKVGA